MVKALQATQLYPYFLTETDVALPTHNMSAFNEEITASDASALVALADMARLIPRHGEIVEKRAAETLKKFAN
jgi:hypothetical protein